MVESVQRVRELLVGAMTTYGRACAERDSTRMERAEDRITVLLDRLVIAAARESLQEGTHG